ncbi:MAG TPA: hypothetical protein VK966_02310 [Longimicrobiales bacterium]|nr:hypothetical protein [Longimicrobiales bacterium]
MNQSTSNQGAVELRRGDRVPRLRLPAVGGGERSVRGRGPRILLVVHPGCARCAEYARSVGEAAGALPDWDADIMVASPAAEGFEGLDGVTVVRDPDRALGEGLTVLVLDRWGEVYHAGHHGGDHDAASPEELLEWVRFVAIQCPECEGPEGPWASL